MGCKIGVDAAVVVDVFIFHKTAEILVAHRDRAVHKVAQRVGELGIHALDHELPGDDAVIFKRHLVQAEVADRVHAEDIGKVVRVEDVALRLGHLAAGLQEPRMAEDLLRKRDIQRHQKDRPVDRMEADDILADEVKVRRPVLPEALGAVAVRIVADARDIVGQRVKPDIDDMLRVEIDRDAPGK